MQCKKCGIELNEQNALCNQCGKERCRNGLTIACGIIALAIGIMRVVLVLLEIFDVFSIWKFLFEIYDGDWELMKLPLLLYNFFTYLIPTTLLVLCSFYAAIKRDKRSTIFCFIGMCLSFILPSFLFICKNLIDMF